jgi:hypothetical protein
MSHKWEKGEPRMRYIWANNKSDCFECKTCGFLQFMKFVLPESTLKAIGVPDCEDYLFRSVMEE